ncbi:MAG: hypothetical protein GY929_14415 [Actinomycetia bacterium]|nr:hypothetical protein [Actinomycetes bacterium]
MAGDVWAFLLHRPATATWIATPPGQVREDYGSRILQRIGVDVSGHSVLNLHRIGVEAPARYVFDELLAWDGDSSCWPNHIATAERAGTGVEKFFIRPLGLARIPWLGRASWKIRPLFELDAMSVQRTPGKLDQDGARFMLFSCKGGYPIGIFVYFVRSPIAARREVGMTQVFLGVSFDFFGKKRLSLFRPIHRIWEIIHNRVTANVLHRFKQLCEWRFERTSESLFGSDRETPPPGGGSSSAASP